MVEKAAIVKCPFCNNLFQDNKTPSVYDNLYTEMCDDYNKQLIKIEDNYLRDIIERDKELERLTVDQEETIKKLAISHQKMAEEKKEVYRQSKKLINSIKKILPLLPNPNEMGAFHAPIFRSVEKKIEDLEEFFK